MIAVLLPRLLVVPALGAVLLAGGCGAAPPAPLPAGPSPAAPPPAAPPPAATRDARAVTLPWPVADAAGVALLQRRVDEGAQPWLLDPASVATAFATAAYGWTEPRAAVVEGADTTVEVTGPGGRTARVLLEQPGRRGVSGIWVVTTAVGP